MSSPAAVRAGFKAALICLMITFVPLALFMASDKPNLAILTLLTFLVVGNLAFYNAYKRAEK